jgi:hypothetical protein
MIMDGCGPRMVLIAVSEFHYPLAQYCSLVRIEDDNVFE